MLKCYLPALGTIRKKRRKHLALHSYCTDLVQLLRQKENNKRLTTRFASKLHELEEQALDTQTHHEDYSNEARLAIIGGRGYANTLDKEISTERREERYETNLVDSEKETDPNKSEQEAVEHENEPLLHCKEDPNIQDTETNFLLKYLPFEKMRFAAKTYYDQADHKLIGNLRSKFGDGAVLIIRDWSAPTTKSQKPQRNKGQIPLWKKNGFQVYLVNEHKTSSICPECDGELIKLKKVPNPRPHKRKEWPTVTCNGLLKCVKHSPPKLYNRDMAAVLNFRRIFSN